MKQMYEKIEALFKEFEKESHTLTPKDWSDVKTTVEMFKAIFNVFLTCTDRVIRDFAVEAKEALRWIENKLNPEGTCPEDHPFIWSDL